jgi:AcrR family transcriptional regulator
MNDDKLKLRVEPVQLRAKETIDLILEISAQLLEEAGIDGLTTKLIAERAHIRVRNIYRYFRNKQEIILALARCMAEEQSRFVNDFEYLSSPDIEWKTVIHMTIDSFVRNFAFNAGMLAIRKAMQSTPELRAVDEQLNRELAQKLSETLLRRGVAIGKERMFLVCRIVLDVTTCLLDRAGMEYAESNDVSNADNVIAELKEILGSYFAPYIKEEKRKKRIK